MGAGGMFITGLLTKPHRESKELPLPPLPLLLLAPVDRDAVLGVLVLRLGEVVEELGGELGEVAAVDGVVGLEEHLAQHVLQLEVVQLRIGGPRETDILRASAEDLKSMHRGLGAYLSVRDQIQLVVKSLETKNINDANGVPFQIFYGISGNSHNFWSLANAKRVIGYAPKDNSAIRFSDKTAKILNEAHQKDYGN